MEQQKCFRNTRLHVPPHMIINNKRIGRATQIRSPNLNRSKQISKHSPVVPSTMRKEPLQCIFGCTGHSGVTHGQLLISGSMHSPRDLLLWPWLTQCGTSDHKFGCGGLVVFMQNYYPSYHLALFFWRFGRTLVSAYSAAAVRNKKIHIVFSQLSFLPSTSGKKGLGIYFIYLLQSKEIKHIIVFELGLLNSLWNVRNIWSCKLLGAKPWFALYLQRKMRFVNWT